MRDWINLFEQVFDRIQSRYSPEATCIFRNPSATEFRATLDRLKRDVDIDPEGTVRGLYDPRNGDIYCWDGYYATHGGIMDTYDLSGCFHLILMPDTVRVLTLWRYERAGFDHDQVEELILDNANLKRMYRAPYAVVIQP